MTTKPRVDGATLCSVGSMGVSLYEVSLRGALIGRVQRYQMGAGQFGQSWLARTAAGHKRSGFRSRDAATTWLVRQA